MLKLRLSSLAVVVAALFAPAAHAGASAEEPRFNPPKQYYLALGDSFTYGFQFSKLGLPPPAFTTGYVDVFATRMRTIRPDLVVVNYGCPGESSVTLIAGGCSGRAAGVALHDGYEGAQLDAAVAFLRGHPGQVSPITLTVWSNDFLELVRSCGGDFVCVQAQAPAAIAQYASRLALILHRLRAAAPSAEIIVSGSWHPFLEHIPLFDGAVRRLESRNSERGDRRRCALRRSGSRAESSRGGGEGHGDLHAHPPLLRRRQPPVGHRLPGDCECPLRDVRLRPPDRRLGTLSAVP
jgi:hypothetical protein